MSNGCILDYFVNFTERLMAEIVVLNVFNVFNIYGNNSKSRHTRVMVYRLCILSYDTLHLCSIS